MTIDLTTDQHASPEPRGSRRLQASLALLLVAALAGILLLFRADGAGLGQADAGSTYTTDEAVTYLEFAGTVRNSGSGWYVINDAGHEPDEITIGTVTSTSLRINYPACSQIVVVLAAVDDTYAKDWSLIVGASAGLTFAVLTGSVEDGPDAGTARDVWDPTTDYSGSSNIWFSGRCIPAE